MLAVVRKTMNGVDARQGSIFTHDFGNGFLHMRLDCM
jgi:hypothetical protein